MKKYILFSGVTYYPGGGWKDLKSLGDTIEELITITEEPDFEAWNNWWHIVDSDSGKIIKGSGESQTGLFGKITHNLGHENKISRDKRMTKVIPILPDSNKKRIQQLETRIQSLEVIIEQVLNLITLKLSPDVGLTPQEEELIDSLIHEKQDS